MRIVFFGTPPPAVPSLSALLESDNRVLAAITAPDRPRGRGMKIEQSPVKERALRAGIDVLQPPTLRSDDVLGRLAGLGADVFVVVAFGLILPQKILNIPRLGCVNVHFSLLPRLRGAAPVQWLLIEGYSETGVTIIQMDSGVDTGPILSQESEPIYDSDDAGTLEERLSVSGARLLVETLEGLALGQVTARAQNESLATYAPKLSTEDARVDWSLPAGGIRNRIRAFSPRPGAWTMIGSRRIKIWRATVTDRKSKDAPGTLLPSESQILVSTGSFDIELIEVQPEGKRRMTAAEFVRGYRPRTGELLL